MNNIRTKPRTRVLPNRNRLDRSTVKVEQYRGGRDNAEVVLYKVRGGGHTEPSLREHYGRLYKLIVGKQNRDFEMAVAVYNFFARNR